MAKSKDLFDDSTMSFGEHLEVLRIHLWRAIIGLVLCTIVALFFGDTIIGIVRRPIDNALEDYGVGQEHVVGDPGQFSLWESVRGVFTGESPGAQGDSKTAQQVELEAADLDERTIIVEFDRERLERLLGNKADVATDGTEATATKLNGVENAQPQTAENTVKIPISSDWFVKLERVAKRQQQAVTLTVQEAFLAYLKVAIISGLVISSPWVFYQLWLFVAAGLYPHERKYVYIYLPVSVTLFLGGAVFCFYLVFPFVLTFLLGFNKMLEVQPQIRLSEWISFAIMLPVMFGISFQLPLVMLFMERISIFEAADYRAKRRMAILVIAIISMFLTPADPMSMLMMMFPLIGLYELGIYMCGFSPAKRPFEEPEAA